MGARRGLLAPGWPPPRGPRDESSGGYLWALQARPNSSYSSRLERDSVARYRRIVDRLANARFQAELSVRDLATATSTSYVTISRVENGSVWPRVGTVNQIAKGVGLRLVVRPADDITASWDPEVTEHIYRHIARTRRMSFAQVAHRIDVQPNTLTQLKTTESPSLATLIAVSELLSLDLRLRGSDKSASPVTGTQPAGSG